MGPSATAIPPTPPAPRTSPLRWLLRLSTIAAALAGALLVAAWGFVNSQASVDMAVREIVARSDGRLEVEGARGSLRQGIEVRRLHWRGPSSSAAADNVELTWSPAALLTRGFLVKSLAAQHVEIEVVPSNSAAAPPITLALPFEITIERLAIARLDWRVGARRGAIDGLSFHYSGGAQAHRVAALSLTLPQGTITGEAAIGATPPFAVDGKLAFTGAAPVSDAAASLQVTGMLADVRLEGSVKARAANASFHAALTPLGSAPLSGFSLDAAGVDLAAWDPALPETSIALIAQAQATVNGFAGHVDATNKLAGDLDARRVPVLSLSAQFAWRPGELALDDLEAEFPGSGHATGHARIPLGAGGGEGRWTLQVRDVDLRQIYAPLIATRLRGSIIADLGADRQHLSADVADRDIAGGLALQTSAVVTGDHIEIERFRARAGSGELSGRGSIAPSGSRAFSVDATAAHFDPSRFGRFPAGSLDGSIKASGALQPAWHVEAQLAIAPHSKLAGVSLAGTARGDITRKTLRNAAVDLTLGSATIKATGSAGATGDRLAFSLDAPRLAELVPLLPSAVPRELAGSLQAKGELTGLLPQGGITLDAKGQGLHLGTKATFGSLDARVELVPAGSPSAGSDFASRRVSVDVNATQGVMPEGRFATAHASVRGTLGAHLATLALRGDDLDIAGTAHGGLRNVAVANAASLDDITWSGVVDSLENRGAWPLRLVQSVTLDLSRRRIGVGATRIAVADGNLAVDDFLWDDGKISTRGSFAAVPLASAAHLAGVTLPMVSTIKLGGAWSLAATPRLNGTATLRRESGDLFMQREGSVDGSSIAVGVTAFDMAARFSDDAIDASATFRSSPSGSADARLAIGVGPSASPGRIALDAPLTLSASADLTTLQLLQPWIGTTAVVDGRAHAELTARGTLARAPISGSFRGDGLRIDAPQYGVHYTDGIVALHVAEGHVVLDDIQLTAGAGKFRASGSMAAVTANGGAPAARLAWHAEKFRAFNRPDRHLVVDGDGTVALQDKKLALAGKLRAEEGRIVYVSDPNATLGDDVVVKGWKRSTTGVALPADVPLVVDLSLDFGDKLSFASQGLDTRLEGVVHVTNGPAGFRGTGSLRAVNGTYYAFGQKLVIDPGRLIFDGPLDNPGLDIVAMRKNLAVEAGVAVTGTVKVPIITLTSNPPLPDGEKLSWLVLGQGLDRTSSGTDLAALQAASAALFGRNAKPVTTTIAESIGLNDITFKNSSSATAAPSGTRTGIDAGGRVVAFGKRLSDKLTLVYEQGLTVATNALRLEYSVSRSVTLRAEAGSVSGAGIYYRRSFE